jgi:hypothetical protein
MTSDSGAGQEPRDQGNEYAPGLTPGPPGLDGTPRIATDLAPPDLGSLILGGSIGLIVIGLVLLVATLRRPRESG